jgi:hypothetical protein
VGDIAQVAKCLKKCKALNSNPGSAKIGKEKREKEREKERERDELE